MTLLTKHDLAAMLRVSPRTIDYWCAAGRLPFYRVGSRKRFDPEAVSAYLASRSFGSHHQPPSTR